MALNDIKVGNLKSKKSDYRKADGGGLYILVQPNGSKLWRYDYRIGAERRTYSIGQYGPAPLITLAKARELHEAARASVKRGIHPIAVRQAAVAARAAIPTFGDVADDWLATRTGKAEKTVARDTRINNYLTAEFGTVPIDQVRLGHLAPLLKKYAAQQPTRIRLQSAAKTIMGFAKVHYPTIIEHSPFSDIDFKIGYAEHQGTPRAAITDPVQFGTLMRKIDAYEGRDGSQLTGFALNLLALTFVRPGTVQKAEWAHFDLKAGLWIVPFKQLKMASQRKKAGASELDHVVPLSRQAVGILRKLHAITGDGRYLFPGRQADRTMSENTLNVALIALGYKSVHCAHGFRSSASTLLNKERTKDGRRRFERSLIELQLDHQDQSVRAIYDRDDCLPERVELMQFWADKIDELRDGEETKKSKLSVVG
jgi:integrase